MGKTPLAGISETGFQKIKAWIERQPIDLRKRLARYLKVAQPLLRSGESPRMHSLQRGLARASYFQLIRAVRKLFLYLVVTHDTGLEPDDYSIISRIYKETSRDRERDSLQQTGTRMTEGKLPPVPQGKSKSKKYALLAMAKLGVDWRRMIWERLPSGQYQDAFAVMAACGCRPAEVQLGVMATALPEGIWLVVIKGAKYDPRKGKGQLERRMLLIPTLMLRQANIQLSASQVKTLAEKVRRIARQCWQDIPSDRLPSLYTLRHAFAVDLSHQIRSGDKPVVIKDGKEADEDARTIVARAMGHRSEATQQAYGRRVRGGGGRILALSSETTPRPLKAKPFDNSPGDSPRQGRKS